MTTKSIEDVVTTASCGVGAYAVGLGCMKLVDMEPLTAYIQQIKQEPLGVIQSTWGMADAADVAWARNSSFSSELIASNAKLVADSVQASLGPRVTYLSGLELAVHVAKGPAMQSAFWAGSVETAMSFLLALSRKNEKPFVVSLAEGGLRGTITGISVAASQNTTGASLVAGAGIGLAAGVVGSAIGSSAAYIFRKCGFTGSKSAGLGAATTILLASPLVGREPVTAVCYGSGVALICSAVSKFFQK